MKKLDIADFLLINLVLANEAGKALCDVSFTSTPFENVMRVLFVIVMFLLVRKLFIVRKDIME